MSNGYEEVLWKEDAGIALVRLTALRPGLSLGTTLIMSAALIVLRFLHLRSEQNSSNEIRLW